MKRNPFNHSPEHLKYLERLDKEFYIQILENSYNEIYVADPTGKILYVNPNSIRNYGMTPEELIGKNNYDIWEGKWNPPIIRQCAHEKRVIFAEQKYLITGKNITTICTPVFDENDEVIFIICIVQEQAINYDVSYKNLNSIAPENKPPSKSKFNTEVIGSSHVFCKMLVKLQRISKSDIPILLLGESGTGKSFVADYIHENSSRKDYPFIMINCAAIPENLLESELFGYSPYAFTGANPKGKVGLVEMANKGTLFLDEIGDLALSLQAKLLDVIENKRFIPVGSQEIKYVDIRIVTATNKNIEKLVEEKKFREDLFWRINIATTVIPPLRDRRDDILPLITSFLKENNQKYKKKKEFSTETVQLLLNYPWPGNVRQLKNLVELAFTMASGNMITQDHLPKFLTEEVDDPLLSEDSGFDSMIESLEKSIIRYYYKQYPTSRGLGEVLNLSQSKANRLINLYCKDLMK